MVGARGRAMPSRGEDLYHRLAVFPITLPPLRDRPEDIPPLAALLLAEVAAALGCPGTTLSPQAASQLVSSSWPGNVRALRNALERSVILSGGGEITPDHLWFDAVPRPKAADDPATPPSSVDLHRVLEGRALADLEQVAIEATLASVDGNRKQAAERLGIGLRTLYDKLKRYGM